jgi:hypothetical protein
VEPAVSWKVLDFVGSKIVWFVPWDKILAGNFVDQIYLRRVSNAAIEV